MPSNAIYTGHLAKLHGGVSPKEICQRSKSVSEFEVLKENKWYSFLWTPSSPAALKFDGLSGNARGPFPFLLRESSDRFILLSNHHSVVQAFFRGCRIDSLIEYPRVNIGGLVSSVISPSEGEGRVYRLGAVFASTEGYGRALKTIAFWGDDLADAALFRDVCQRLAPFRAAIRDVRSEREIASIGSGGEVSLYYRGLGHLDQTDRLFRFFTNLNAINWGAPHA